MKGSSGRLENESNGSEVSGGEVSKSDNGNEGDGSGGMGVVVGVVMDVGSGGMGMDVLLTQLDAVIPEAGCCCYC